MTDRYPLESSRATGPTSKGRRVPLANTGSSGGLSGPPKINPYTGCPYKGVLLSVGPASLTKKVGCQVTVTVGDGDAGAGSEATRTFVVAPGAPVYLALGAYGNVDFTFSSRNADKEGALNILWTDDASPVAANVPLLAPIVSTTGGVQAGVPEGAYEVEADSNVNLTWVDSSGGADVSWVTAVAAGARARVQGSIYTPSVGNVLLRFYLAPF